MIIWQVFLIVNSLSLKNKVLAKFAKQSLGIINQERTKSTIGSVILLINYPYISLACDKMCKMSQTFNYRLDSGSGCPKEAITHFGIDVGPF